ncbi:MAG: hypothetical protein ACOCRX_04460 [Candidatus Woesearchaeota archaeon]
MPLGKPPEGYISVIKIIKENVINIFLELKEKYPGHPSYSGETNVSKYIWEK